MIDDIKPPKKTEQQPEVNLQELQAAAKQVYHNISTALAGVFAEVSKQLGTVLDGITKALGVEVRPTVDQLNEIADVFNGRYATVGEAFQHLKPSTREVATTKWLLFVSSAKLEDTSRWHWLRRYRLKKYVAELDAVYEGQNRAS